MGMHKGDLQYGQKIKSRNKIIVAEKAASTISRRTITIKTSNKGGMRPYILCQSFMIFQALLSLLIQGLCVPGL